MEIKIGILGCFAVVICMWAGIGMYTFAQMKGWIDVSMPYKASMSQDQDYYPTVKHK